MSEQTCMTPITRARSSVGFQRPRSLVADCLSLVLFLWLPPFEGRFLSDEAIDAGAWLDDEAGVAGV